jgi:hypothetical protein
MGNTIRRFLVIQDLDVLHAQAIALDAIFYMWYQDIPASWTYATKPIIFNNRPKWELTLLKHPGAPNTM